MSPIERKKKVMQWQAPRDVVQALRVVITILSGVIAFTLP